MITSLNKVYRDFELGYRYIICHQRPFYCHAARLMGRGKWYEGHVGVDTLEEVIPLAKEIIDYNCEIALIESEIGRPLNMNSLPRKVDHMVIAVDFDGTIVKHAYPKIGEHIPEATVFLRRFIEAGAKIILWSMRDGKELEEAIAYLSSYGITLHGVNTNPEQERWTKSCKAYAHLYIDDAAFGCPLIYDSSSPRPYADWRTIGPVVLKKINDDVSARTLKDTI